MKVYTKLKLNIDNYSIIEEVSFEHAGPVVLCKGGGDTVDKNYNDKMAKIQKQQNDWAGEMYNQYKFGTTYDPNQIAKGYIDSNTGQWVNDTNKDKERGTGPNGEELITKTFGDIYGYDESVVSEMEFGQQGIQYDSEMLAERRELGVDSELMKTELAGAKFARKGMADAGAQMDARAPVISEYYKAALKGVDPNDAMNRAQADVSIGMKGASGALKRDLARSGVSASSNIGVNAIKDMHSDYSKNAAYARTSARDDAADTNFSRLSEASGRGIV